MSKKIILSAVALSALVAAGVSMATTSTAATPDRTIYLLNEAGDNANLTLNQPMVTVIHGTRGSNTAQNTIVKQVDKSEGVSDVCEVLNGGSNTGNFYGVGPAYATSATSNYKNPMPNHIGSNYNCATVTSIQIIPIASQQLASNELFSGLSGYILTKPTALPQITKDAGITVTVPALPKGKTGEVDTVILTPPDATPTTPLTLKATFIANVSQPGNSQLHTAIVNKHKAASAPSGT